jgi:hypothetical protein
LLEEDASSITGVAARASLSLKDDKHLSNSSMKAALTSESSSKMAVTTEMLLASSPFGGHADHQEQYWPKI